MAVYKPLFKMTNAIIDGLAKISERLGMMTVLQMDSIPPLLHEECNLRNVCSTLVIDNVKLNMDQVRLILADGTGEEERNIAVKNTYRLYEAITEVNPFSMEDLMEAHFLLMDKICKENGRFRTGEVRVYEGNRVIHVAPPFRFVSKQMSDLLEWYQKSEMHPLVKSAVLYFEFECIHPFSEGNGRLGRLWYRVLMGQWKKLFYYLPVEDWILSDQDKFFAALGRSYKESDGNTFVEMLLEVVLHALEEMEGLINNGKCGRTDQESDQEEKLLSLDSRVLKLLEIVGNEEISALEIMAKLGLKHRPTFRNNYLNPALEYGIIVRTVPDKPNSRNQRYRKKVL